MKYSFPFVASLVLLSTSANAEISEDAYFGNNPVQSDVREGLGDYRPLGMEMGGFLLFPQIKTSLVYDDNVLAGPDNNEQDDFITIIEPSLRIGSNWERHALGLAIAGRHEEYNDLNSESVTNGSFSLGGRLDVGEFSTLSANAKYLTSNERRAEALSPLAAQERIAYDEMMTDIMFSRIVNRIRMRGGVEYQEQDYDDGFNAAGAEIDQDFRDFDKISYTARLDYALSPAFSLFTDGAYNITNFDFSNRDSDGYDAAVGIDFDITDLIRGDARVGVFNQKFDAANLDDTTGLLVAVGADWYITPLTSLRLDARRDRDEEATSTGSDSIKNDVGLTARHRLLDNLLLEAGARYRSQDFQEIDREDTRYSLRAKGTYYIGNHFTISPTYLYGERESEGANAINDFKKNVVMVTFGAAL